MDRMSASNGQDFPHLRTGRSQYPEKLADARECFFCGRRRKHGPVVGKDSTLCLVHDNPDHIDKVTRIMARQGVRRKSRKRLKS